MYLFGLDRRGGNQEAFSLPTANYFLECHCYFDSKINSLSVDTFATRGPRKKNLKKNMWLLIHRFINPKFYSLVVFLIHSKSPQPPLTHLRIQHHGVFIQSFLSLYVYIPPCTWNTPLASLFLLYLYPFFWGGKLLLTFSFSVTSFVPYHPMITPITPTIVKEGTVGPNADYLNSHFAWCIHSGHVRTLLVFYFPHLPLGTIVAPELWGRSRITERVPYNSLEPAWLSPNPLPTLTISIKCLQ